MLKDDDPMPAAGGQAGSRLGEGSEGVDEGAAERAKRYREHSTEICTAAKDITHPASRAGLLRLAETYERLAAKIEAELKESKGGPGRL
jgi:hypothetical protein